MDVRMRPVRRYFSREIRCSHLWFVHEDWRPFSYSPWIPYWWKFQWLYPMYRCILSFYFLVWLVYSISNSWFYGVLNQHFSFLSNWNFSLWNIYLMVSAVNVSLNQLRHQCHGESCQSRNSRKTFRRICCSFGEDESTLGDKISWLLFIVSTEIGVSVTVLYWSLLSSSNDSPLDSALNLNIHLFSGVFALLDLWVVGLPVQIVHFFYTFLYASCYVAFTGVHYAAAAAANSTEEGEEYIYSVLDYGSKPALASGVVLGVMLGFLPFIHILFILQSLARSWITTHYLQRKIQVYRRFLPRQTTEREDMVFNVDDEDINVTGTAAITNFDV